MPRINTFLWFDGQAEEAARFYVSLFPHSKLGRITPRPANVPGPGEAITVDFELMGQAFTGLNGGPNFKFTEAVSFQVSCETQAEIDRYWDALTADGGEESMCGWCRDRFGVWWQVTPAIMPELLNGPHAQAVTGAFMTMRKFDLARIEAAARGEAGG
jgi:predicted 3-demethylubiquinone-9 3-methyltransferase (glyoxalase superfamily)